MKTLDDVIKEMKNKGFESIDADGALMEVCEHWMRQACEAMRDEIVPEKITKKHKGSLAASIQNAMDNSYNDCRDEILKNIERFMGGEK